MHLPVSVEDWCHPGIERAAVGPARIDDPRLEAAVAAVQLLLADDPATLPAEIVLERQRRLLPLIERLKVAGLGLLSEIDSRELHSVDGAPTAHGWMRTQPVAPDGITVTTARRLRSLPHAAREAAAGRLSVRDVTTIAAALARVPADVDEAAVVNVLTVGIGEQLAELTGGDTADAHAVRAELAALAHEPASAARRLEAGFVLFAQRIATVLPAGALRPQLDVFVDALLPEQHDERDAAQHADRHLDLEPVLDGGWHLRGLLDAETGEAFKNALERFTSATDRQEDERTVTQQRHDALRELCRLATSRPDAPSSGGGTEIVVHTRAGTLDRLPGALPARLASGMRLSPAALDRLCCEALFTPVLLDQAGRPLAVGRTRRLFTTAQRKAMAVQWGGRCAGDGCPNAGDIAHHVKPWERGGATDLENGIPVCKSTHHDVHTGGKTIRLKDGRWIGPEGFVDGPAP